MSEILTAAEILEKHKYLVRVETDGSLIEDPGIRAMIEFAKLHAKAALEAAAENAYVQYIDLETEEIFDYTDVITDDGVGADVNKSSILNSYPLTNIK